MPSADPSRAKYRARNPRASPAEHRRALSIARDVAREYRRRDATAVVLGGSWARGDAHRASDIDLCVFGLRPGTDLLWRPPLMVVVDRVRAREQARRLRTPPTIGGSVPGWPVARILYDPRGLTRRLRREAARFRWSRVARRCDRWVARQMALGAEEVVKLVRALAAGDRETALFRRLRALLAAGEDAWPTEHQS